MRLDHVSYAAETDGLKATAARLGDALGVTPRDGGVHPRFGTRNVVLPLAEGNYLEVVEPLDHPASDKAPFGQAVKARSEAGGGWLGWVVGVDDLGPLEARLGRESVPGNRHRPDGVELRWHQLGIKGLISDPQLPYLIHWEVEPELHPSAGGRDENEGGARLMGLTIAGDPDRVTQWLGVPVGEPLSGVEVEWTSPRGTPGLMSVSFFTASGPVTL